MTSEDLPDEQCGNEIWWNGGAESGKIGAHGWYGSYLTAYDTGLHGGYGIFTNNEVEGSWENIYASGFNDSGMYLGACQECKARITEATMEDNALGYSGSNSGGSLAIEDSLFRHNSDGIVPNSENPGDGPPPQDGECNRPETSNTRTHADDHLDEHRTLHGHPRQRDHGKQQPDGSGQRIHRTGCVGSGNHPAGRLRRAGRKNMIANNANDGLFGLEREVRTATDLFQLIGQQDQRKRVPAQRLPGRRSSTVT